MYLLGPVWIVYKVVFRLMFDAENGVSERELF